MKNKKRIILLKYNLRITASGARAFFNFYIPKAKELVADDDGYFIDKSEKKKHYFLICVSPSKIEAIRKTLRFISSYIDVTDEIVNDRIKTKELGFFDLDSIYKFYRDYYFEHVTVDSVQAKIEEKGTASVNNFDFQLLKDNSRINELIYTK